VAIFFPLEDRSFTRERFLPFGRWWSGNRSYSPLARDMLDVPSASPSSPFHFIPRLIPLKVVLRRLLLPLRSIDSPPLLPSWSARKRLPSLPPSLISFGHAHSGYLVLPLPLKRSDFSGRGTHFLSSFFFPFFCRVVSSLLFQNGSQPWH